MKRALFPLIVGLVVALSPAMRAAQDIREGLVSYWPLDAVLPDGITTEDVVSGNTMTLNFMDSSSLVQGQRGMAMTFDGLSQYLSFTTPAGMDTGLPISLAPSFSVLLWVNGIATNATTGEVQADRRVFSEASSTNNNPLFNIGTHNGGLDNSVDMYIRDVGGGVRVNHLHSPGVAYNGQWHHIAWTDSNGVANLYIDGVLTTNLIYVPGNRPSDITSIGAILRAAPGNYFGGTIDDVAVWERELSQSEIQQVMTNGIQTPVPAFAPTIAAQPVGNTNLIIGDSYTLSVRAAGTRPFTYQWFKDGSQLGGQTGSTLALQNLQTNASGSYSVQVGNIVSSTNSADAVLLVSPPPAPNLTNELIAYWPLEEICGTKTPELVNGYDMNVDNLTAGDIVPGHKGNAFTFNNTRKTLLWRVHNAGEQLPVNQYESFTISMWANVAGLGQVDLRLFSEGNTGNANPLFNIGTDQNGANSQVDFFFRQTTGGDNLGTVDHVGTDAEPLDGTWHHLVFVQDRGARRFYIDGVQDTAQIPDKPAGNWALNDTTIGGILRSSASHWVSGMLDEVALWKRALTAEEVGLLYTNGIPNVGSATLPLEVRQFAPDFAAVAKGDKTVLRWDVNQDATVSIDHGVGDVTSSTQCGVGSVEVTVNSNTTYTITLTRGTEMLTATTSVVTVDNVAAGWRLLDNLERLTAGPIAGQGNWQSPDGVGLVDDLGANKVLGYEGGQDLVALPLKSLTLKEGQKATLFFRVYASSKDTNSIVGINVGLTERPIRFVGDFAQDIGPYVRFERLFAGDPVSIVARYGFGGFYDIAPVSLDLDTVYDVWIDITNAPPDGITTGDTFSVFLRRDSDTARTLLFQDYVGDRNPAGDPALGVPKPDLESLVAPAVDAGQGTNNVVLDDFFISNGNYLDTVPVPASSFVQVQQIQITGQQYVPATSTFEITWTSQTGSTYTVQRKTDLSAANWTDVATGVTSAGATTTYSDNVSGQSSAFYQVVLGP